MPISDVARTNVVTASTAQSAGNLATLMAEENVGSVVIEQDDEPVGIVTDRDLVIEVFEPRKTASEVTAGDIMTETLATATADEGIFEVTEKMHEHSVRRMPVVDDDGKIAGIVTLDDFVVMFTDELSNLAGVVEAESPDY